jgi:hypothetical protein
MCFYKQVSIREALLSYGPAATESQLTGVMWYKDTPGHQDKTTADNKGFTSQKALTAQSKSVQMYHQSFRQLSQKYVVLDVIHVATGNRIYFDFYASEGVFTAGLFQSFDMTHSYGRT